jgi:hypothetical protein
MDLNVFSMKNSVDKTEGFHAMGLNLGEILIAMGMLLKLLNLSVYTNTDSFTKYKFSTIHNV